MDYEVNYATLERAGSKATGLANDIAEVLADMHMDDVEGAIPGGVSGGAATSVSNSWKETSSTVSKALQAYGTHLTDNAVAYRQIEDKNAEAATKFFGGR